MTARAIAIRRHRAASRMWRVLAAVLAFCAGTATATTQEPCRRMTFESDRHVVCEAPAGSDLRLFLHDGDGAVIGSFATLDAMLASQGQALAFAMNGGMYHPDRRPVGLYIEDGAEHARLVTRAGPGNFGLLPNGVFCIAPDRFEIIESRAFADSPVACRDATQSGPMLVIDGALHPRFIPDSDSRLIRNGVGVSPDGQTAYLVISDSAVNFHSFARFFRDVLGTDQALYLDGNRSRLYAPGLGRSDIGLPMGPILGLVVDVARNPE